MSARVTTSGSPVAGRSAPHILLAAGAALIAIGWLISRVFLGLDFTDEMQYYGEISALTRTGSFFRVDWFIQQLGYIFTLPFFKLHAWIFPDDSYLVLFGRLLLLGGYTAVGRLLWQTTRRLGGYSPAHRILAVAVLAASAPFQIFSPSYNSLAFLLLVAALGVALTRRETTPRRYTFTMAALLTVLTYVYPTAGLGAIALAGIEVARRRGMRAGAGFVAAVAAGGAFVLAIMLGLHGSSFPADLGTALQFSRAFGTAHILGEPDQLAALAALIGVTVVFVVWQSRTAPAPLANAPRRTVLVSAGVAFVAIGCAQGWLVGAVVRGGFVWTAIAGLVLMLVSLVTLLMPDTLEVRSMRRFAIAAICASALAISIGNISWVTPGYFASTIYVFFLVALVGLAAPEERSHVRDLAIVGTTLGTVFALTSGTRLQMFGLPAAATFPFMAMFAARRIDEKLDRRSTSCGGTLAVACVAILLVANAAAKPYRDDPCWPGLRRIEGIPALAGIAMSPTKLSAARAFATLVGPEPLAGRHALVAGPHPWVYFATRTTPRTPMFFMHFTGRLDVYDWVAHRMQSDGAPEVIFVTDTMPSSMARHIVDWTRDGYSARVLRLPDALLFDYRRQMQLGLGSRVMLFVREPRQP